MSDIISHIPISAEEAWRASAAQPVNYRQSPPPPSLARFSYPVKVDHLFGRNSGS